MDTRLDRAVSAFCFAMGLDPDKHTVIHDPQAGTVGGLNRDFYLPGIRAAVLAAGADLRADAGEVDQD